MIRWIIGCVSALTLSFNALADTATLMSRDDLREALIESLQDRLDPSTCIVKLKNAALRMGPTREECQYFIQTDRIFSFYTMDPESLSEIVAFETDRLSAILEGGVSNDNFADRLVVQLRGADFLRQVKASQDEALVARQFTTDLHAVLMLDSEDTLAAISPSQLSEYGLEEKEAFELALQNTRHRMGDIRQELFDGMTVLSSANGLITGQVWLPETCQAESEAAFYFLYDQNGVLKVEADNLLGISNLLSIARGMSSEGRSLTNSVLSCRDGQWSEHWSAREASLSAMGLNHPG